MNDDDISKATAKVSDLLDAQDTPEYDKRLTKLSGILLDLDPELRRALHEVVRYLDHMMPRQMGLMVMVLNEMIDEIENPGARL